jgi:hypothetical protein
MQSNRDALVDLVIKDIAYKKKCKVFSPDNYEDLYHDIVLLLLEISEERLPTIENLPFWFFRVAKNKVSKTGCDKKLRSEIITDNFTKKLNPIKQQPSVLTDAEIKKAERIMIELTEFENRVITAYNQLGNMKKVARFTGIPYASLRIVKDKIRKIK